MGRARASAGASASASAHSANSALLFIVEDIFLYLWADVLADVKFESHANMYLILWYYRVYLLTSE